jgi:hypothetical protein
MTTDQLVFIAISFLILAAITAAAQFRWLPRGRAKVAIVFLSGVAIIIPLRLAAIPPWWFEGEMAGFGIAVMLLLWAFVSAGNADGRTFGRPLLLGMGITVLAINVVAAVQGRL